MTIIQKKILIAILSVVFLGLLTYNILNPYEDVSKWKSHSSKAHVSNEYTAEVDSLLQNSASDQENYSSEEPAPDPVEESSIEEIWEEKYRGNQLANGAQPYSALYGKNKQSGPAGIIVTAPSEEDALVMVKNNNDRVVRHAYIRKGRTYTFHIPAGTYQVYFICGNDWCPEKEAPNGQLGYFLYSSVSKDSKIYIGEDQALTYKLQLMEHGNFTPQGASTDEAF